jgi:hypothetical protein
VSIEDSERALMRLALELMAWLESASDAELDSRTAVNWLESICYVFQNLPRDARARLNDVANELAEQSRVKGQSATALLYDHAADDCGFGQFEGT